MQCNTPYTASCLTNIVANLKPVFTTQLKEKITEKGLCHSFHAPLKRLRCK